MLWLSQKMIPKSFTAKDGRFVILRQPQWEDLDGLLDYINSLVREEAPILLRSEVGRTEEVEWLARRLVSIEKGEVIHMVAEVHGKIVAGAEITKHRQRMEHVGTLGIGVKYGYRRIGIAIKLIETLINEAKRQGLKIILLDVHENNLPARNLYNKLGFKEVGKIPKGVFWKGQYIDMIRMALEIEDCT